MSAPLDRAAVLRRAKAHLDEGCNPIMCFTHLMERGVECMDSTHRLIRDLMALVAQAPQLSEEERKLIEDTRMAWLLGLSNVWITFTPQLIALCDRHFPPSLEDPDGA